MNKISREVALQNLVLCVDNALATPHRSKMPDNARLCVWHANRDSPDSFIVVAAWSYLGTSDGVRDRLDDDEAAELATELLVERCIVDEGYGPDYVL